MSPLTAAARCVHHGGFRRAAVDDERAAAARDGVCQRKPYQVRILIELVAVAQSIRTGCRCALSEDDDEAGKRDRQHQDHVLQGHMWDAKVRETAGYRSDD